ncbi:MAG TPA: DUF2807 domain-containing protein, partial [Burkholderiaceae bacterium]
MKQRRLFLISALSLAALSVQAGDWNWSGREKIKLAGEVATESRDVGAFDGLSLGGDFKVQVRQGSANKLVIKADKALLPYLESRVVESAKGGRRLEVGTRRGFSYSGPSPELSIEMPTLHHLAIAGSGEVVIEAMKTTELEASIAGSGDVRFTDLQADSMGLKVSGSGNFLAKGRATNL